MALFHSQTQGHMINICKGLLLEFLNCFTFLYLKICRVHWLSWWRIRLGIEGFASLRRTRVYVFVSLSKTLYPLLTGSTQKDRKLSWHDCKTVDWDIRHQYKQPKDFFVLSKQYRQPCTRTSGLIWMQTFEFLWFLILYISSTIFQLYRDRSFWVEPVLR